MALITETLGPRKYEIIRDQIAMILADELINQAALNGDPETLPKQVWLERLVPLSAQELPAVNIFAAEGEFNRFTRESQTGEYLFAIDVFTRGATEGSTAAQRGDQISTKRMHRIVGIIHAILSHWKYENLALAGHYIDRVEVKSFKMMEPVTAADGTNVAKGRLIFYVKAEESIAPVDPVLIAGYDTTVMLHETQLGYVFSGDQPPFGPPVCTFDVIIYGSFAAGDDLMVPFVVDTDSAGTFDEIFSDVDSGALTISVNGSPFVAFSAPLILADGDILSVKRSGTVNDGWYKLKGNY